MDILGSVKRGRVALAGAQLRQAVTHELELLGVLSDMEEQGLTAGELRQTLRLQALSRARVRKAFAEQPAPPTLLRRKAS